jgi:hypothetical protein
MSENDVDNICRGSPPSPNNNTISVQGPIMDTTDLVNAIPAINNFFTIASIGCVSPTYFLRLRSGTYRLMLSLGIVFGLSILAISIAIIVYFPFSSPDLRYFWIRIFENCSPLDIVLVGILTCIRWVNPGGFLSTVVLVCVIVNWATISFLVLALRP